MKQVTFMKLIVVVCIVFMLLWKWHEHVLTRRLESVVTGTSNTSYGSAVLKNEIRDHARGVNARDLVKSGVYAPITGMYQPIPWCPVLSKDPK